MSSQYLLPKRTEGLSNSATFPSDRTRMRSQSITSQMRSSFKIWRRTSVIPCAICVQWWEQCNLGTSPRFSPLNENKFAISFSTWMSASVFGSTLAVASSRTMILFLPRIARAKHTSCRSPTERLDPGDELSWSQLIKLDPGYDEEDFDGWHWPS